MQIISRIKENPKLRPCGGGHTSYRWKKHRFRMSYISHFFYIGFVCRDCDELVLVERDVWFDWIRGR